MPFKPRPRLLALLAAAVLISSVLVSAAPARGGVLIPEDLARRNGMVRAWFSQVQLNPARNEVESVTLHDGVLVALTTAGVVHTMDAETGRTLWTVRIGNPAYPSLGPAIDEDCVAIVNGSMLFVLDRADGRERLSRRVGGGVGGGPALAEGYAYVPLFSGKIEGYAIDNSLRPPWYYNSRGRIFQPAVADASSVVWSTDQGSLFVAASNTTGLRYRFDTASPIVAPATVRAPLVYAGSLGGYLYALHENTGQQQWRYAAGFPIRHSPVVVGDQVFVATEETALHAIDAETGQRRWLAPGVSQFVAASQTRVYGIDDIGGLVALDVKTGVVQARAASRGLNTAVLNDQTDRLYIFSDDGLVQCFHEIGADEPFYHQPQPEKKKDEGEAVDESPGAEETPAEEEPPARDPFAEPAGADPFGGPPAGGEETPAPRNDPFGGDPFGGEDPFGGADPFGGN